MRSYAATSSSTASAQPRPNCCRPPTPCARANNVPLHLHAGYAPGESEIYRDVTGISQLVHLHQSSVSLMKIP